MINVDLPHFIVIPLVARKAAAATTFLAIGISCAIDLPSGWPVCACVCMLGCFQR